MKRDESLQGESVQRLRWSLDISLQRALLLLIAVVLVAALVPAGIALDRRLAFELGQRTKDELKLAVRIMTDRSAGRAAAMMMHAKELAHLEGLSQAVIRGNRGAAVRTVETAAQAYRESGMLTVGDARWAGVTITPALLEATRHGEMPIAVIAEGDALHTVALAPIHAGDRWLGAAGVATHLDAGEAGMLAGLTRSAVLFLTTAGRVAAATMDSAASAALANAVRTRQLDGVPHELRGGGRRYLAITAPLGDVGSVVFARDLDGELAIVPQLRRMALVGALGASVLALIMGAGMAALLARPVRALATAAGQLADGDFSAPLGRSAVREVNRVAKAFEDMRRTLAARIKDLATANEELGDRQSRLIALQAELMQRNRQAATGQLVVHLAHEIRNPVANVRNCLELIRRRMHGDAEGRKFADMAIDELLRMHDLAEQMLDMHRPRDGALGRCDAVVVANDVAALARAGGGGEGGGGNRSERHQVVVRSAGPVELAVEADSLKQLLLNLVQNAGEACVTNGRIEILLQREERCGIIEVLDDGPGIPEAALARVFDPFFTTKGEVHGVGLGLFVAEGIVRAAGGHITAANRERQRGARFRMEFPLADPESASPGEERNGVADSAALRAVT